MKVDEIEDLWARYYGGETTQAEEEELKRFFTEEDVPSHLLTEKELFLQLAARPEPEVPAGLENKLNSLIDGWETSERRMLKVKKHTRILRLQWVGSIAASLLLLFAVGLYLYKSDTPSVPKDTCSTPEEAYVQAQKALVLMSSRLNKGLEEMETIHETTDKVKENVYEQLNRINFVKQ